MKTAIILVATVIFPMLSVCAKSGETKAQTIIGKTDSSDYVEQLNLNDPTLLNNKWHIKRVSDYLRQEVFEEFANDTSLKHIDNQWMTAKLRVALRIFSNPEVKNHWLYSIMYDQIDNYGIKNTDELMKTFYDNCTNPDYVSKIKELYKADVVLNDGHTIKTYKTIDGFNLDAHIFYPPDFNQEDKRPAIIFFHGGAFYQGAASWTFGSCKRFASLGMVAIGVEYRLYDRHGTTPLECISDAKSVIRWLRENAEELGIDPEKIVTFGYSAGGHIAACAGILDILDEPFEDLTISSVPNAMIFYYSCFDPTIDKWFNAQVEDRYDPQECSPNHNIRPGLPPSLVVHGTNDRNCPFWTAEIFVEEMTKAGNRCELLALEGAGHVFIFDKKYKEERVKAVNDFLVSLGYLLD